MHIPISIYTFNKILIRFVCYSFYLIFRSLCFIPLLLLPQLFYCFCTLIFTTSYHSLLHVYTYIYIYLCVCILVCYFSLDILIVLGSFCSYFQDCTYFQIHILLQYVLYMFIYLGSKVFLRTFVHILVGRLVYGYTSQSFSLISCIKLKG